jgi:pimeloyl-ACP methyl ester carboxylesterase
MKKFIYLWLAAIICATVPAPARAVDNVAPRLPVLVVPGALGTGLWAGNTLLWPDVPRMVNPFNLDSFMDPLKFTVDLQPSDPAVTVGQVVGKTAFNYDYAQSLVEELHGRGYRDGLDLFLFPYDWRYGVDSSVVEALKNKIDDILRDTGTPQVDIVAHSTGGLIVKKYVEDFPDHHIRKAVMVGVPNLGAPKALKVLLQGDNFGVHGLEDSEMKQIAQNLPVVYDLLPSAKYIVTKNGYVRVEDTAPDFHFSAHDLSVDEMKQFIVDDHGLNATAYEQAQALHKISFDNLDLRDEGIDVYNIAGCKKGTIGTIVEQRDHEQVGILYSYGAPHFTPGDGTVPLESATNLPLDASKKYYALKSDHSTMLSQDGIRQTIADIITGAQLSAKGGLTQDIGQCKLKGNAISIYSPVSIEVTDQSGGRLGLLADGSIENTLPNADMEILGDHTFVYLPEEGMGTYSITLAGTDTGSATIQIDSIDGDSVVNDRKFSNIAVTAAWRGRIDLQNSPPILLQESCLTNY